MSTIAVPRHKASLRPLSPAGAPAFASAVTKSLVRQGYSADRAASLALVYQSSYLYIEKNWESLSSVYERANDAKTAYDGYSGAKTALQANVLLRNATEMNASKSILKGFSDVRLAGAAGVASGLVDVMQIVAAKNNIPLNECALSVAKVSLDLVGVVSGGLSAETGFGAVLAMMNLVSLGADGAQLGSSCKLL